MSIVVFLLIVLSAILHATWNLITKKYAGNYSLIYLSFCIGFVLCLPLACGRMGSMEVWLSVLPMIVATGILHAIYGFLLSLTYNNGDISTLYPIVRGSGILGSVILALLVLGEALPISAQVGVSSVILGIVVLSYRRNRAETSVKGIVLGLMCGSVIMAYTVLDKLIVGKVDPFVLLLSSQFISAISFLPYVVLKRRTEFVTTVRDLKLPVMVVAVFALLSYLIILFVFQIADVSRVVVVRELSVVFGAIAGYVFLKESFSKTRLIGVVVVLLGIILVKW